jgi:hypothetical protein
MIDALKPLSRFVGTVRHTKHRLFFWMEAPTLPDSAMFAFASAEDWFFGVLHSQAHEVWARAQATQVRDRTSGLPYTPSSCFETFPFPDSAPEQETAIANAANELNALRERWLNPPDGPRLASWSFPDQSKGRGRAMSMSRTHGESASCVIPALSHADEECAAKLKKRTLTNLYNERPAWLAHGHAKLDAAVAAAYGWPADLSDDELRERLLALNLERAAEEKRAVKTPLKKRSSRSKTADEMI